MEAGTQMKGHMDSALNEVAKTLDAKTVRSRKLRQLRKSFLRIRRRSQTRSSSSIALRSSAGNTHP